MAFFVSNLCLRISRKHFIQASILSFCAVCLFGACSPKGDIRLLYNPVAPAVLPSPTAPRLVVVQFTDQRANPAEIGRKRDNTPFVAAGSVSDWVSRSLGDEISRLGLQVSYAISMPLAQSARPDYLVTGTIDEVWLKETSPATYAATVRISVNLSSLSGNVNHQALSASQEKTGLPTVDLAEGVLSSTLREVLGLAASKITALAK